MDLDGGFWGCLILATIHSYHSGENGRAGIYSIAYLILALAQLVGNIITLVGDK